MRRLSIAGIAMLASLSLVVTGCTNKEPAADSSTPMSTEPVGVSVDDELLPTVEGVFGKDAEILFPLKPGETRPPKETPTPEEEPTPDADADGGDGATPTPTPDEGTGDEATPTPTPDEETPAEGEETPAEGEEEEEPPSPYLDPPETLQSKVVSEGDGEEVKAGNLVTIMYRGQKWGSDDAFDENFTRNQPVSMRLEVGYVITGWARGLQGKKLGSRVLLVVPPSDGYGITGDQYGIISGTDTIVFAIDLIAQFDPTIQAQTDARLTGAATDVVVTGQLGSEPVIQSPTGLASPEKVVTTVLAEGTGETLEEGDSVLIQFKAVDWSGREAGTTWLKAAGAVQVEVNETVLGDTNSVTPFSGLLGKKVGSRVLVELPGKTDAYLAVAAVVDIVVKVPKPSNS